LNNSNGGEKKSKKARKKERKKEGKIELEGEAGGSLL